jgi:CheY-like chemotaxis protein
MEKKIKILHFENEPVFAELYKAKFSQIGFAYKNYPHPPGGRRALIELVIKEDPNIILMDIIMPGLDGIAAAKIINSDPGTAKYPIFTLSNLKGDEDIKKAFRAGITDYFVSAEYTPKQLTAVLQEYLKNPANYRPRSPVPEEQFGNN